MGSKWFPENDTFPVSVECLSHGYCLALCSGSMCVVFIQWIVESVISPWGDPEVCETLGRHLCFWIWGKWARTRWQRRRRTPTPVQPAAGQWTLCYCLEEPKQRKREGKYVNSVCLCAWAFLHWRKSLVNPQRCVCSPVVSAWRRSSAHIMMLLFSTRTVISLSAVWPLFISTLWGFVLLAIMVNKNADVHCKCLCVQLQLFTKESTKWIIIMWCLISQQ